MMVISFAVLWCVAALASAVPYSSTLNVEARDAVVTTAQFAHMKLFAEYAGASYCANNNNNTGGLIQCSGGVCPTVQSNGAVSIVEFESSTFPDAHGFVATDPVNKLIIVSLRGSVSVLNYIDDILFLYTSCDSFISGCRVHSGFYSNWLASKDIVVDAVKSAKAKFPSYSLVVTGHSLGGAVATIAAAYLRSNGFPCDLYTYGSPRVGNGILADFVSGQPGITARVTHEADIVPRLPPLLTGYRHTSPEYWLQGGSSTTTNYNISNVKVCTGNKNTDCNAGQGGFDVTAHEYYFEYIGACSPDLTWSKRDESSGISDVSQAQLRNFGVLDIAFFSALAGTNATSDETIQLMGEVDGTM